MEIDEGEEIPEEEYEHQCLFGYPCMECLGLSWKDFF